MAPGQGDEFGFQGEPQWYASPKMRALSHEPEVKPGAEEWGRQYLLWWLNDLRSIFGISCITCGHAFKVNASIPGLPCPLTARKLNVKKTIMALVVTVAILLVAPLYADTDPISSMAKIMLELNHFPAEEQANTLKGIMADSTASAATRVIANAIVNIKHQATAQDKQVLASLAVDEKQSAGVKTLASVVRDFNHKVSPSQQQQLEALVTAGD